MKIFFSFDYKTNFSDMDGILDAAKEKLSELTTNVTSLFKTDVIDQIKDYGIEKINDSWSLIENSTEIFRKSGYSVTSININLGIPPSFHLSFDQIENISDEEEAKLLDDNKSNTMLYAILVALFKANALQKSIHSANYKFTGLNIGLGITPSIDMKFTRL